MILSLERLFDSPGEELAFEESLDLSGLDESGALPLKAPVQVRGVVHNLAGIVTVDYTADYILDTVCDRCLDAVHIPKVLTVSHVAVRSLSSSEDDDYLVLPDAELAIDEMVYSDLVLDLPSKVLCAPDCQGLCPVCGVNHNRETCSCSRRVVDPRLRVLEELLE